MWTNKKENKEDNYYIPMYMLNELRDKIVDVATEHSNKKYWQGFITGSLISIVSMALIFGLLLVTRVEASVDCTEAVIHHTESDDVGVDTITKWHKERGWDTVGYHYIIRADGTVEKGRDLAKTGAHARGRNNLVGIALTGREVFTEAQIDSLCTLLVELKTKHVQPHHENCPGPGINLDMINKYLEEYSTN